MRSLSPYRVYLLLQGTSALFFAAISTMTGVYLVTVAHLSPFQLLLVGTVLETTAFLTQLPTGIVADLYSRRLSVIVGTALIGLGFMLEGALPILGTILLAQVIWGIGATFVDGAQEAWVADEVGGDNLGRVYLRGAQAAQIGGLLGIGLSVLLASVRVSLPIVVGGGLNVLLAGALIAVMPERHFHRGETTSYNPFAAILERGAAGLRVTRGRPVLVTILIIGAIYGASTEALDRLWEAHLIIDVGLPWIDGISLVVWFGMITAVALLLSVGATEMARRRVDADSPAGAARALLWIDGVLVLAVVAFGLAHGFVAAVVAYWSVRVLRRTHMPIFTAWVNQGLEPRVRATIFSLAAQTDALGQIAGGPVLGLIGSAVSIPAALVTAGLALAPAIALYARTLLRHMPTPLADEED